MMDITWVTTILERFYNLGRIGNSQKLDGYYGHNFLIQAATGKFILKLTPSDERLQQSYECQLSVMQFLHSNGIPCPVIMVAANGQYINRLPVTLSNVHSLLPNQFFLVALLGYIPGRMLRSLHPVPYHLFHEAGRVLAKIHQVAGMYGGNTQPLKDLNIQSCWSLENTEAIRSSLSVIEDEELSSIISCVMDKFEELVVPVLPRLPRGIIHGDYNDDNILVSGAKQPDQSPDAARSLVAGKNLISINGIIDFCDMTYSCFVVDIAKALSFMVITDTPDIGETIVCFMRGYSIERPLTQGEHDVLPLCLLQSLGQNTVLALKDYSFDPTNEYLLESVEDYPVVLKRLYAIYKGGGRWM